MGGSIMLKLTSFSIALLLSAVFVNSKTVRPGSKECAIACEVLDFFFALGGLDLLCKNGKVEDDVVASLKSEIISKCGAIDFEMGDDHVKNELELGDLDNFKNNMPSFFGELEIV